MVRHGRRSDTTPDPDGPDGWFPSWVTAVGLPVWVTSPDREIAYLNARAEQLLGRPATECIGQSCAGIVRGTDSAGRRFCERRCAFVHAVERGTEVEPHTIEVHRPGSGSRWLELVVIPLADPGGGGCWLVHCAVPIDREHRITEYIERVADRTPRSSRRPRSRPSRVLTRRELEVLDRLALDEDIHTVAKRLHVSPTTVRNHVQHILTKLGAHSSLEAVALHLLDANDG